MFDQGISRGKSGVEVESLVRSATTAKGVVVLKVNGARWNLSRFEAEKAEVKKRIARYELVFCRSYCNADSLACSCLGK